MEERKTIYLCLAHMSEEGMEQKIRQRGVWHELGGAYLHAYGAGVDFFPLIWNNMNGIENERIIGQYDDDILMLMYDDVVIRKKSELVNENFSLI